MTEPDGGGYRMLNPKCKSAMYVVNTAVCAILAVPLAALWLFADKDLALAYAAAFAAITIILAAVPQIFYRHYRYRITFDSTDVRRGVIIIRRTVVPVERIHQVEVVKGPINRFFGLSDVYITTAGGTAKIEFLDLETAAKIAEDLSRYVNETVRSIKSDDPD
jgi:membrane protein YdbS with pleckstrin-like domain